ncbi:MAG TPA: diguanylate cyclase [Solirubrobacteraceae bacterium]|nr:diguanylate cyclase [Solirubrobacteraceae bacterium]
MCEATRECRTQGLFLTLSIGVSIASGSAAQLHPLYEAGDEALYQAKAEGRDRVSSAHRKRPAPAPRLLPEPAAELVPEPPAQTSAA